MEEDNYLQLSGIQHFAFCPRQWALIHVENFWTENLLTAEGRQLHERVDNPFEIETRGNLIVARAVRIASKTLKLAGVADVVEFRLSNSASKTRGVTLPGHPGYWVPHPVEYKRGKPKSDDRDSVQLCAQAICLEELLGLSIDQGELFYGEIRRRERVVFDSTLRRRVGDLAAKMHELFELGITPPAKAGPNCRKCSLVDICLPKLTKKSRSVDSYICKILADMI